MSNKYEFYKLRRDNDLFIFSPRGDEKVLVQRQCPDGKVEIITLCTRRAKELWTDLRNMGFQRQADSSQPGGVN